jgi:hypothetical protein
VIRNSYRSLQDPVVDAERPKRSADVFRHVEELIASRPEFRDLPDGCPHLRNAILYCRSRKLPISQVLDVRQQMIERSER